MTLLAQGLVVEYRDGEHTRTVLHGLDLSVGRGSVALMGPSGSGKSSLLRVLAGLQVPQSGQVLLDGTSVAGERRRSGGDDRFGFVYQDFKLISFLTVLENVLITSELRGVRGATARAHRVLEAVGLTHLADRRPTTLSGGERQRVAIARAIVAQPRVILADEPTGALDREIGQEVIRLLLQVAEESGCLVVLATHDDNVAAALSRRVTIKNGRLAEETTAG